MKKIIKKVFKFVGIGFGCFIGLIIFSMIVFHDDIERENHNQDTYYENLQYYADSLNYIYTNHTVDIIGDDLLDSLKVNYERLNDINKISFFKNNYKYYRVNKILHSDQNFIDNYNIDEILYNCENDIKSQMKNPDSYDFVGYNIKYVGKNEIGNLKLTIRYRGTNSFNAIVTEEMTFSCF